MKTINTAIIGFGVSGSVFNAPIINATEGFAIKLVYTTNPKRQAQCKAQYPDAEIVTDVDDIFKDDSIDLVVITSLTRLHFELAEKAILAGKNVVVEKPFTVTSEEADKLIKLAAEKNVMLSAYQNRRWDGDFKTTKKVIESGLLGDISEVECRWDAFNSDMGGTWGTDAGQGLLYALGTHMIDQALYLFGIPKSLRADLRVQRENVESIDNVELELYYGKLKVVLKVGMLLKLPTPRFLLQGANGTFVKYGVDIQEDELISGLTPANKNNWGLESEDKFGEISAIVNGVDFTGVVKSEPGDYRGFYENIYKVLTEGAALNVTPQQAANNIKIIELAIKSNEEQRTVAVEGLYEA